MVGLIHGTESEKLVKKTANKNQRGLYCSQETVQMIGLGWLVCLFVVVVVVVFAIFACFLSVHSYIYW